MTFSKSFALGMALILIASIPAFAGEKPKLEPKRELAKSAEKRPEIPHVSSLDDDESSKEIAVLFFPNGMSDSAEQK